MRANAALAVASVLLVGLAAEAGLRILDFTPRRLQSTARLLDSAWTRDSFEEVLRHDPDVVVYGMVLNDAQGAWPPSCVSWRRLPDRETAA